MREGIEAIKVEESRRMPENHKARLHIEYELLYAADFRTILRLFDHAYNALQRTQNSTRRLRRADRLTIQTVRTGNTVTLIVLGGIGLYYLNRLIATRKGFWESEKIKWEAQGKKWKA